jgi:hypothetical protein
LCILPYLQHRRLAQELFSDDVANGALLDHSVAFLHGYPFGIVGLAGQQYDLRKGSGSLQAIVIEESVAIPSGFQQLEFRFFRPD